MQNYDTFSYSSYTPSDFKVGDMVIVYDNILGTIIGKYYACWIVEYVNTQSRAVFFSHQMRKAV